MKRRSRMRILFLCILLLAGLLQSGCAVQDRFAHLYNDADFQGCTKPGNGIITGRAFLKTCCSYITGRQVQVRLVPVTPYTTARMEMRIRYANPGEEDSRLRQYQRTTVTDNQGRFRLINIPAGDYYLTARICKGSSATAFNPLAQAMATRCYMAWTRVWLQTGETVDVEIKEDV